MSVAPKGHYAALDSLPDWGGAWFVTFSPRRRAAATAQAQGRRISPPMKSGGRKSKRRTATSRPRNPTVCRPACRRSWRCLSIQSSSSSRPGRVIDPSRGLDAMAEHLHRRAQPSRGFRPHVPGRFDRSLGGRTLVVETIGTKENLGLTSATRGPVPAHGPKLRILERIHLDPKDPDSLLDEVRARRSRRARGSLNPDDHLPARPRPGAARVRVCGERPKSGRRATGTQPSSASDVPCRYDPSFLRRIEGCGRWKSSS